MLEILLVIILLPFAALITTVTIIFAIGVMGGCIKYLESMRRHKQRVEKICKETFKEMEEKRCQEKTD